jgi:hypothetical protein
MEAYRGVLIIGIIEVLIGTVTLLGNLLFTIVNLNFKAPNILLFVIISASMSTLIGIGILKQNRAAYYLLLYFSSVILLTKFLMFAGIISISGELEVSIHAALNSPASDALRWTMNTLKTLISTGYHGFLIYYLLRPSVKSVFYR